MSGDHVRLIKDTIRDEEAFIRATFSSPAPDLSPGPARRWVRVVVRPVLVKNRRHLQFSYFEKDRDISKNFASAEAARRLDQLLRLPFRNIHLQTTRNQISVTLTPKGKPRIRVEERADAQGLPDLRHDRQKDLLLGDRSKPFLQRIGIMTQDGRVKAGSARKFTQINEFLKLLQHTGELERLEPVDGRPILIADLGCGSASLTFATYHYLHEILGRPTRLVGVDLKWHLVERQAAQAEALGWGDVTFHAGRIAEFVPPSPPDIVLALHACDTATDEALAQGIRWGSRLILSVPCCHHQLHEQLNARPAPLPFEPVLRHGILKERWGDVLTDAFRALILRIMGYRTDVIEFVSEEHTARNLMIRAGRASPPGDRRFVQEYMRLRDFWQVTPYLQELLGEQFAAMLR